LWNNKNGKTGNDIVKKLTGRKLSLQSSKVHTSASGDFGILEEIGKAHIQRSSDLSTNNTASSLTIDVNPLIDPSKMQVGGMEYTHIEADIAAMAQYGDFFGRRSYPEFSSLKKDGRPYWTTTSEYKKLITQIEASTEQFSTVVDEALNILEENNIWGHSITGFTGHVGEIADGLHSIVNFGLRSKEHEPPWVSTMGKSGHNWSAGDFFKGYAALIILPEGVEIYDVVVKDEILHQNFIPTDYLVYVLKTQEEAENV
jgi:hypothetical protein